MTLFTASQQTSSTSDISGRLPGLIFDLKRCTTLIEQCSAHTEPNKIAQCTTDGLIEQFNCTFARIWLVEPDRNSLRLIASSGLYTHLEGSFSRVPMGAFKVGKIAQHCIPFLSNCLPQETWVKDRQWAIDNNIQGFAGLPLMEKTRAIGVVAIFSQTSMAPELLEVLQILSASVSNSLAAAVRYQALSRRTLSHYPLSALPQLATAAPTEESLSETLSQLLGGQKLSLLGTEQSLSPVISQLLLQLAHQLSKQACHYCRLVYETNTVFLEALLSADKQQLETAAETPDKLTAIAQAAHQLGGQFQLEASDSHQEGQAVISIRLPQQPTSEWDTASPLSTREQEVIELIAQGRRDREIAEALFISDRTVKFHVKNMLNKLDVRTRSQAVFKATKQGWLT
ncbi:MAG: LuxR C-terminal-related transcriptional regulator [Phormidesmis sp.]